MKTKSNTRNSQWPTTYWRSVLLGGFVASLIVTAVGLIGIYIFIDSEPTGTLFGPQAWLRIGGMLLGAAGGIIAIRHYVRNRNSPLNWWKGALMGGAVGIVSGVLATLFTVIWLQVDTTLLNELKEATVANIQSMDPKETDIARTIEMNVNQIDSMKTVIGNLIGAGIYSVILGILNAVSGIIGTKIFKGG